MQPPDAPSGRIGRGASAGYDPWWSAYVLPVSPREPAMSTTEDRRANPSRLPGTESVDMKLEVAGTELPR